MTTYTTTQGETWDLISYRVYGSEYYLHLLLDANPASRYAQTFDAGTVLVVPDLKGGTTVNPVPWMTVRTLT